MSESATEVLCKLLDERGDDYTRNDFGVTWSYYSDPHTATESMDGTLIVTGLTPEQAIAATLGGEINGDTSDGYHTFNELYHHRAVLFSVIVENYRDAAWKAKKHHDGTMYDGMFIVGLDTPWGQASYHYDIDPYWDMFDCEERVSAPEWDGHTPDEAIERIGKLATLSGGKLTAEQVRKAANGHYELRMVLDVDGFDVPQLKFDWQAIADELNASLGSGTCERTTTRNGKFKTKYGRKVPLCECCGYAIGDDRYNFCPKCGAKIVKAVKR